MNLKFQELDAATLPRAIDENVAGIVNLTDALPAGLTGSEQIYKRASQAPGTPTCSPLRRATSTTQVFRRSEQH